ncbi:MAG: type II toxin-antitoxin system RelE/ParE family toxin [Clostridiales bacterium]|jgi:toxin ParE1/3/4|nr:type II toxin-antitoxin system RelE/ParE family toxin [Clostridiales bacterium]
METYDVHFLQEALDDLEEIVLYIANDSHQTALRMHTEIIEKANDLSVFPKRGRLIPDKKIAATGYRMLSIKPYIAFYRIVGHNVFIYRILYGATNYPLLYEKMRSS